MATALMVIGMIGLLAAIIIPVAAAVFTGNSGGDGLLASLYFAKYPFYASSLTIVGYWFQDEWFKESFTEDGGTIFCLIISFLALCIVVYRIVRKIVKSIQTQRQEQAQLARQKEIQDIQNSIRLLQQQRENLQFQLGDRDRMLEFTKLLSACGAETQAIDDSPEMQRTKEIKEAIKQTNREIADLTKKL